MLQLMKKTILPTIFICSCFFITAFGEESKKFNIGYIEAGSYIIHSQLYQEYFNQLEQILPNDLQVIAIPEGYRSAEWLRSNSKKMAKQLTDIKHLDLVIAVGPWVVEDLLDAGFKKPIIAMHQINPKADGLLDANNRPIVDNLTVHFRPGKVYDDLVMMTNIFPVRKLGVLFFPSDSGDTALLAHIRSLGESLGFEVLSAEEYDNNGTYAFYKSYAKLRGKIDALYLPSLWGLDAQALHNFFRMLNREHIPTFTDEGSILLDKGATATNNYYGIISEARYQARKTVDILEGQIPADLPVIFRSGYNLAINRLSAKQATVEITSEIENNCRLVGELPTEDIPLYKLNELVNRSLVQNPGFLAQSERKVTEQLSKDIIKAEYFPTLYGTAAIGYLDKNLVHNSFDELDSDYFQSRIHLRQKLLSFESLKKIKTATSTLDITSEQTRQTQLDLELAVSLAYLDYLRIKEKIGVIQNLRGLLDYNIEVSHAQHLLSNFDSLNIMQLDAKRYDLILAYTEQKHLLQATRVILNALLNLPGSEEYLLDDGMFSEEGFIKNEAVFLEKIKKVAERTHLSQQIETVAYKSNPEIVTASYIIERQKNLLATNKASFYPTLDLHASLGYNHYLKETDSFQEKKTGWEISGQLTFPFFLGGQRFKEKSKLTSELHTAEYEKDAVLLNIMKRNQTEIKKLFIYAEQMTPAYIMKRQSFNILEMAVSKFSRQDISTIEFIYMLENAHDASLKSIQTRYNYYAATAKLVHLMGISVGDDFSDFLQEFHKIAGY